QRCLATHATTGCRIEVPVEPRHVELDVGAQRYSDDVECLRKLVDAVGHVDVVLTTGDDALTMQEPERELEVIPWSPHCDGDAVALVAFAVVPDEPDFQGLLDSQPVTLLQSHAGPDPDDRAVDVRGKLS